MVRELVDISVIESERTLVSFAWSCLSAYVELWEPWRLNHTDPAGEWASLRDRLATEVLGTGPEPPLPPDEVLERASELTEGARRAYGILLAAGRDLGIRHALSMLAPYARGDGLPVRLVVRVANPGSLVPACATLLPVRLALRFEMGGVSYWRLNDETGEPLAPAAPVRPSQRTPTAMLGGVLQRLTALPDDRIPLVLDEDTQSALAHVGTRWRHRGAVGESMGTVHRIPGVLALLVGPTGHGKRTAARELAEELGLELHAVRAALLLSRYIGETEERVTAMLEEATRTGTALLVEDAQDLLSGRTGVHSANDRYANLSTNHLLVELDRFPGLCLLTSEGTADFDPALLRRVQVIVRFGLLDPPHRSAVLRAAWEWLRPRLPEAVLPTKEPDWDALALRCQVPPSRLVRLVLDAALDACVRGVVLDGVAIEQRLDRIIQAEGGLVY